VKKENKKRGRETITRRGGVITGHSDR